MKLFKQRNSSISYQSVAFFYNNANYNSSIHKIVVTFSFKINNTLLYIFYQCITYFASKSFFLLYYDIGDDEDAINFIFHR